jgi:hypothetical protein
LERELWEIVGEYLDVIGQRHTADSANEIPVAGRRFRLSVHLPNILESDTDTFVAGIDTARGRG